jgi:hypothetical protein
MGQCHLLKSRFQVKAKSLRTFFVTNVAVGAFGGASGGLVVRRVPEPAPFVRQVVSEGANAARWFLFLVVVAGAQPRPRFAFLGGRSTRANGDASLLPALRSRVSGSSVNNALPDGATLTAYP